MLLLPCWSAASPLHDIRHLPNAGYIVADESGQINDTYNADRSLIPASTTKLVTAWLALNHWGEAHRFTTSIQFNPDTGKLWVKGGGDPFLVSEEIEKMADQILALEPKAITEIVLDVSLFEADLIVPGATTTNNPYDAVPSAIAANFNTVYLKRTDGKVISAEPQTPLTLVAESLANEIEGSSLRINTGRKSDVSGRYFAQLLASFLRQKGVEVSSKLSWAPFPEGQASIIYTNGLTLGEVLKAMLKYSTNFIANQIILTLVAEHTGQAANFGVVQLYIEEQLHSEFGWTNVAFFEGAGLSTHNQITPRQLLELVIRFEPWQHLLDEVATDVFAKTGTLTGVSTLAGFTDSGKERRAFAILINENVDAGFTRELASEIAKVRY